MPALFVLDTEEFLPLVRAAEKQGLSVRRSRGYAVISSTDEILIERLAASVGDAIWHGALTGGFEGIVAEFSGSRLRLVSAPAKSPSQP